GRQRAEHVAVHLRRLAGRSGKSRDEAPQEGRIVQPEIFELPSHMTFDHTAEARVAHVGRLMRAAFGVVERCGPRVTREFDEAGVEKQLVKAIAPPAAAVECATHVEEDAVYRCHQSTLL